MSEMDAPEEYFCAVEAEFVRLRGASMLLSPRDWALIGAWHSAAIPLRIVIRGIANVFEAFNRRAPQGRRINSLSYCRQEVLFLNQVYLNLKSAEAGRPGREIPPTERTRVLARHLGRLAREARQSMALASESGFQPLVPALALTVSELKRLRREARTGALSARRLEDELRELDDRMLAAARDSLPEDERRRLDEEVNRSLDAERARMTGSAFESTRRAHLARRLRERCRISRLTVFD